MIRMIGEWFIDKIPGPLVPVVFVLYDMALEACDALRGKSDRGSDDGEKTP